MFSVNHLPSKGLSLFIPQTHFLLFCRWYWLAYCCYCLNGYNLMDISMGYLMPNSLYAIVFIF